MEDKLYGLKKNNITQNSTKKTKTQQHELNLNITDLIDIRK